MHTLCILRMYPTVLIGGWSEESVFYMLIMSLMGVGRWLALFNSRLVYLYLFLDEPEVLLLLCSEAGRRPTRDDDDDSSCKTDRRRTGAESDRSVRHP